MNQHVICGCWFIPTKRTGRIRRYLPQVQLQAHTTIQSTASRTRLKQTFQNNTSDKTPEVQYTFPIYDGVSVVSFKCTVGDKVILGVVKERNTAKADYNDAVSRGEVAGLLEQNQEASDVFTSMIGNIPKGAKAVVEIEYVGELKHDAQLDGVRFMIPTQVAPRYGDSASKVDDFVRNGTIEITVDVETDEGIPIEGLSSPSHPIAMTMGRTTTQKDTFKSNRASATLSLGSSELGKDFIVVINAQDQGVPKALLEQHPDFPNHRAVMTTLVPKFNLPSIHPEIVFVVDRSGSMGGKMPTVIEALRVFLKSLPLSAKFNICSFGSSHDFLFEKSLPYDERSLQSALTEIERFDSNYGGTELLTPIQDTVKRRLNGVPLEIMVLTDGEIWNQQAAFDFVNEAAKSQVRLFSLGIGAAASTALVEGLARAGNGFAQFVQDNEKMDKRVIRMLKAALTPHITNYKLKINYDDTKSSNSSDDDFEMVDTPAATSKKTPDKPPEYEPQPTPISLFDSSFKEAAPNPPAGRYDHLPKIDVPAELQAPNEISGLFPYNRVSAYLLLPDSTRSIKSVTLQGMYNNTPVRLEIPIQDIGLGMTVHQLAAKKAMLDTEEGRGWLSSASSADGKPLKTQHESDWERIVEREAVRLGVKFQVAGKFCSFVAVERNEKGQQHVSDTQPESAPPKGFAAGVCGMFQGKSNYSLPLARSSTSSTFGSSTPLVAPPQMMMMGSAPSSGLASLGGKKRMMSAATTSQAPPTQFSGGGGLFGQAAPPPAPGGVAAPSSRSSGFSYGGQRPALFQQQQQQQQQSSPAPATALFGSPSTTRRSEAAQTASFSFGAYNAADEEDEDECAFDGSQQVAKSEQMETEKKKKNGARRQRVSNPFSRNKNVISDNVDSAMSTSTSVPIPDTIEGKMHKIIGLQRFDGSWSAVDELFKLTGVWRADFDDANFTHEDQTVKATILAIAWLEKEAAKESEVWEMVVEKAKAWLSSTNGIADADGAVRQAISVFFP